MFVLTLFIGKGATQMLTKVGLLCAITLVGKVTLPSSQSQRSELNTSYL